ncbi:alanine:cation symporter family protein, partial [bacterium]|nr:alanine:cation symporter family protein [bacterium]
YVECTLSMQYRVFDDKGEAAGGPMYYIEKGLGKSWKPMAIFFAVCGVISSFGSGNMNQANTVSLSAHTVLGAPTWVAGLVMAALVGLVIIGGIRRIGAVSSRLAPAMFVLYSLGAIVILFKHLPQIPDAFALILREAFHPTAGLGGTAAGVFMTTLIWGVKRGLFSNEAGQGSAPIAHAAAKTDEPVREGVVAMLGPFIDTLVICSLTGLAIVLTGVWSDHRPMTGSLSTVAVHEITAVPAQGDSPTRAPAYTGEIVVSGGRLRDAGLSDNDGWVLDASIVNGAGDAWNGSLQSQDGVFTDVPDGLLWSGRALQNSSALTTWAFESVLGRAGSWIVTLSVFLFALSTTISWSYYGDRCAEYLFGLGAVKWYRYIYVGFVFLGAVLALEVVWTFGDLALGLMAAPNLIAIFALTGRVKRSTDEYFSRPHPRVR